MSDDFKDEELEKMNGEAWGIYSRAAPLPKSHKHIISDAAKLISFAATHLDNGGHQETGPDNKELKEGIVHLANAIKKTADKWFDD